MFDKKVLLLTALFFILSVFAVDNKAILPVFAAYPSACMSGCPGAGSWCIEPGTGYSCFSGDQATTLCSSLITNASTPDCPPGCTCSAYLELPGTNTCGNRCIKVESCGMSQVTPTPGSGESPPPPNPTPTPSPTPTPTPFCSGLKIYRVTGALDNVNSWDRIDNDSTQLAALKPGDQVYLVVRGAGVSQFNRARFFIDGQSFDSQDTTPMQPLREFYYQFTIPNSGSYQLGAEVRILGQWW